MANVYGTWQNWMVQLGRETTHGTSVAATTCWRGPFGGWQDERKQEEAEEDIGLLMGATVLYDTWLGASMSFPDAALSFEQVNHLFEGGIATVTPSGAGPYVRDYTWVIDGSAPVDIKSYTIEAGNTLAVSDGKKMPFSYVSSFQLSGKAGEAWKMQGDWMGPRLLPLTAFTAAIAKPTIEIAQFSNSKLYIDASAGTIGTTQKTGVLMGFSVKVETGIEYVPVGDGNLYYTVIKRGRPMVTFSLTLELQENSGVSTVAVERAAYEAKSFRLLRILTDGSTANRKLTIDLAGRYTSVGKPQKVGKNNSTVTFEGKADISSVDSLFAKFSTTTSLATIP